MIGSVDGRVDKSVSVRQSNLMNRSCLERLMTVFLPADLLKMAAPSDDGFWRIGTLGCQVGAVLLARHGERFAVIRKAPKEGYPFSRKLALPGGMTRYTSQNLTAQDAMGRSVKDRALAEAGLPSAEAEDWQIIENLSPVVSSYPVGDQIKHAALVAWTCEIRRDIELSPSDRSVDCAKWISAPLLWERFSPANCVLIASVLWISLPGEEQDRARDHVEKALAECTRWAEEVSLPGPRPPWNC